MLQRALANLLIFSWIVLSGFDVTEDLSLPDPFAFQDSSSHDSSENGPAGLLARNIVESAAHEGIRCSSLQKHVATAIEIRDPDVFHKVSKLHKVLHVFII
jgi:hypothetical protein